MQVRMMVAGLVGLVGLLGIPSVSAQGVEPTVWRGYMAAPGFEDVEQAFDVWFDIRQDGPQASGLLRWQSGEFEMRQLVVLDDEISFHWAFAGIYMECLLKQTRSGLYAGGCVDQSDEIGPMVMARPGLLPSRDELSVDAAYAAFGLQRPDLAELRKPRYERETEAIEEAVPAGERVEAGGLTFNVYARGSGPATVVFEAGLGDGLAAWKDVLDGAAAFARVVAYDRPGLGYSPPADPPASVDELVDRLRNVLAAVDAPPPYVLVGHESGAFVVRRFAARYPADVAGLVLVHPAHEQQRRLWTQLDPERAEKEFEQRTSFHTMLPDPVPAEYALFTDIYETGEFEADLPDVPMIVLTGTRTPETPRWIAETVEARAVLNGLHVALANASPSGMHKAAPTAGPYVQYERPDLVLDAIRRVLEPIN